MRRVRVNRIMLAVFLVLTLPIIGGVGYVWLGMKNSGGRGSMDAALKLKAKVEAMPTPDEWCYNRRAGSFGVRFTNGEWVTGVAMDSHRLYSEWFGGGTVVLKDSRGRVRCFLGHVCGRWDIELKGRYESLDDIDATLAKCRYTEQPWP